jgi:hypothetical protein
MIIKRISLKEKSQSSNSKVQGAFLQVAMELAIRNAYALVAVVFLAGLMVSQLNKSDAAELSTFYSNHLEVYDHLRNITIEVCSLISSEEMVLVRAPLFKLIFVHCLSNQLVETCILSATSSED